MAGRGPSAGSAHPRKEAVAAEGPPREVRRPRRRRSLFNVASALNSTSRPPRPTPTSDAELGAVPCRFTSPRLPACPTPHAPRPARPSTWGQGRRLDAPPRFRPRLAVTSDVPRFVPRGSRRCLICSTSDSDRREKETCGSVQGSGNRPARNE